MKIVLGVIGALVVLAAGVLIGRSPILADLLRDRVGSADTVVKQIQSLSRLETTRYTVETVVTADEKGGIDTPLGRFELGSDKLLLIVHGNVVAGIDLERLRAENVTISDDGKTVTVNLPAVEVFSVALDNEKTRVYDRTTWLMGPVPDLETRARQEGAARILAAACADGLMKRATEDATRAVERFLSLLDYEVIQAVPAAAPACPTSVP